MTAEIWPYAPAKLSELIERDTLAVLITGCCARLKRAITVLDYDHVTQRFNRIDPVEDRHKFSMFCQFFRDSSLTPWRRSRLPNV